MSSPSCRVQGFLAAGHVCSVMGVGEYPELARRFRVPIVVTGFEPLDILEGVRRAVRQLERGEHTVDNAYARAVRPEGNPAARAMLEDVFEVTDRAWRGIGVIPDSGWQLSSKYRDHDAEHRFAVGGIRTAEPAECRSGEVLQGLLKPHECEAFGTLCTPYAAGSHHGLQRGRLRGVLPLPAAGPAHDQGPGGEPRCLTSPISPCPPPWTSRGGRVRRPCGTGRVSSWGTAVEEPSPPNWSSRSSLRPSGARCSPRWVTPPSSPWAEPGWRSPPTRTWCGRCSSPAAASATWRSTGPSTTSP